MEKILSVLNTSFLFLGAYFLLLILIILTKYTKMSNIIKKILKITGIIAIVSIIIGIAAFATVNSKEKTYWKDITLSEFYELNEGDTPAVIFIGRPTCSHCVSFSPKLRAESAEAKVEINYFNLDLITDEATFNEFKKSNSVLNNDDWGTPLVILVKNKTVIDVLSGDVENSEIIQFFEDNNLGE